MLYRPNIHLITSEYLLYSLQSSEVIKYLHKRIGGSTVGHAKVGDIKSVLIPLPPTKAEQEAIAQVLTDMDDELDALQEQLDKARQIKQGMMHELLTGRIRLV